MSPWCTLVPALPMQCKAKLPYGISVDLCIKSIRVNGISVYWMKPVLVYIHRLDNAKHSWLTGKQNRSVKKINNSITPVRENTCNS